MNIDMAKRLVDRRRAAGLSQEALAEELGVTRQAVSKWERSESSPDTDNLIALAALYGVSLDDLLYQDVAEAAEGAEGPCASSRPAGEGVAAEEAARATDGASEGPQPEPASAAATAGPIPEPAFKSEDGKVRIGPAGIHVQGEGDGDYVHITWRDGVHVRDSSKGDEVHVGWDGVHVNDRHYNDWHEAHVDWLDHAGAPHPRAWRNWNLFPFPLVVIVLYAFTALESGGWLPELALFLTIPVYYSLGGLLFGKRLCAFLCTLYAMGAVGWFFWMCLEGQPHPAWVALLTIPVVTGLFTAISRWWRRRKEG